MAVLKQFSKLIDYNSNIDYRVGTVIAEYDIRAAHTSACYFIYGKEKYEELMAIQDKLERNSKIGNMLRNDPTLREKINTLLLSWFNRFCTVNNIQESNFISSTRDSMVLVNKKPLVTSFDDGIVLFRNKEGEYTTYVRIKNLEVLYDSMSGNLRIKGVNQEYVDGNPTFIRIFKQMLNLLESGKNTTVSDGLRKLTSSVRLKYINSADPKMYASLLDGNKYAYLIDGDRVLSDAILPEKDGVYMLKHENYKNFILPLMKIYFYPH
jgi:hypothetical protein